VASHHCIVQLYFIRIKGGVLRADYAYLTTTHLIAIIFGIKYGHICCKVRLYVHIEPGQLSLLENTFIFGLKPFWRAVII
jgi:hypothetical protein